MFKLDNIDRKILLSLMRNSRAPFSAISKEIRTSREIVQYRLRRLEEGKIIKGYIARINQPLFCAGVALAHIKLVRSDTTRFNEITSFIDRHPSINWCIETCGTSDLSLTILYDTPKDLAETITELSGFIGVNMKEHEISLYIDEYKFDRSGLIAEKPSIYSINKTLTFDKDTRATLDNIDIQIISMLARNCRTRNVVLSKTLKVTEDLVRLRIRNLEKRQIITGYTISVDAETLGFEAYEMSVAVENMTDSTINKIKYYVQTNPYIIYCSRTSGKYNIMMNIYAKDRAHFSSLLLDIRDSLPEIVDYEFQLEMKTHKEVFVPEERLKKLLNK